MPDAPPILILLPEMVYADRIPVGSNGHPRELRTRLALAFADESEANAVLEAFGRRP
jgi:hypothetical protein